MRIVKLIGLVSLVGSCARATAENDVVPADGGSTRPGKANSESVEELSCSGLEREFNLLRNALAEAAARPCGTPADCEPVAMNDPCFGGCGAVYGISAAEHAELDAQLGEREAVFCAEAERDECSYVPLPCVDRNLEPSVACVDGRCVLVNSEK